MPREKEWTIDEVNVKIKPLARLGWSAIEISRSMGISRQRLYKILKDLNLSFNDLKEG